MDTEIPATQDLPSIEDNYPMQFRRLESAVQTAKDAGDVEVVVVGTKGIVYTYMI
jgi:hypothetical protein